ncbi:MAG TPA: FAD-dependent oxidoreductase [Lachnospiraceae bacterium]|nr:FAD-dependent oxidoreductase [Lachnospiraceae bacterium]
MIRITNLKLPVEAGKKELIKKAAGELRIKESDILEIHICKKSLDARKKPDLFYIYTVDVSLGKKDFRMSKGRHNNVMSIPRENYRIPPSGSDILRERPVIVGCGPAGLFAAYLLARCGYRPLILERGGDVKERSEKVESFWDGGKLDPETNVQFGEGGAGTFSDGKLNTSVKDPQFRAKFIKEVFAAHGADPSILYEQKPHVGTDVLVNILSSMRKEIESMGGEYRFHAKVTGIESLHGHIQAVTVNDTEQIPCSVCILALGHSARDTFAMLSETGLIMQPKAFAFGVRIEHPQSMIDISQYGKLSGRHLAPAAYKLTAKASDGHGVYSFCMCPGGYVVNSSSEHGMLAVNGMSYSDRGSANANSAIIVTVSPEEYVPYVQGISHDALTGIEFQRILEKAAYSRGDGKIPQQLFADFQEKRCSVSYGEFDTCAKGGTVFADLNEILPEFAARDIGEGVSIFGRKIRGFDRPDAILSGIESRSSSPVRIPRNEEYVSSVEGIYPCGEGAGYAGGIISAAMDGLRCAESIIKRFRKLG